MLPAKMNTFCLVASLRNGFKNLKITGMIRGAIKTKGFINNENITYFMPYIENIICYLDILIYLMSKFKVH